MEQTLSPTVRNDMRALILLTVLLSAGCTSSPTLEELEDEALRTGNWEAVEEREALIERRDGKPEEDCPKGQTQICVDNGSSTDCSCAVIAGRR